MKGFNTTILYEGAISNFDRLMHQVITEHPTGWVDPETGKALELCQVHMCIGKGWMVRMDDRSAGITAHEISECKTQIIFADGRQPGDGSALPIGRAFRDLYQMIKEMNSGPVYKAVFPGQFDLLCRTMRLSFEHYLKWPWMGSDKQLQLFYEKNQYPASEGVWGIWAESEQEKTPRWATIEAHSQRENTTLVRFLDGYRPGGPVETLARPIGPVFSEIREAEIIPTWSAILNSTGITDSPAKDPYFESETIFIGTSPYGDSGSLRLTRWISFHTTTREFKSRRFRKAAGYLALNSVPYPVQATDDDMVYITGRYITADGDLVHFSESQWLIRFRITGTTTPFMRVECQCREPTVKEYYAEIVRDMKRQWPHLQEADHEISSKRPNTEITSKQRRGRPRLTHQDWQKRRELIERIIQRSIKSGISERTACDIEAVPYSTYRYWRRKLNM